MWQTVAEGTSLEEFRQSQPPVDELPKGTKLRLEIETPWWAPIAPLADLFGAEWVADTLLDQGGAIITDVEGVGWHKVVVHMEADPAWLIPLIIAIAGIVGGIALIITVIKLEADIPMMFKWGAIAVIAASVAVVIAVIYRRRR